MRGFAIAFALTLGGCTSQFALGPATWGAAAPVIPGFTAVPLGGGGFVEEPNSMLTPPAAPAETPIETVVTGLEQAQKTRTLVRQLAR
jgi:hypothetical protein